LVAGCTGDPPRDLVAEPAAEPGVVYGYDAAGRLLSVTGPDGETAEYGLDSAGNRTSVQLGSMDAAVAAEQPPGVAAPVVHVVSPAVAAPGDRVVIEGEHFAATALGNAAVVNRSAYARVVAASATRLVVVVPPSATSGPLSVATPGGTATAAEDLVVVPWFSEDSVGEVARTRLGEATTVALPTAGQAALLVFEGERGQRVALELAEGDLAGCGRVEVGLAGPTGELLSPDPEVVDNRWCGDVAEDAVVLPADGTYTVAVAPDEPGSLTVTLRDLGRQPVGGDPVAVDKERPAVVAAPGGVVDGVAAYLVDLSTGLVGTEEVDLALDDVVPVQLARSYQAVAEQWEVLEDGPFGVGWRSVLDLRLETSLGLQYADLVLPSGAKVAFERVGRGSDEESAVFAPGTSVVGFSGAEIGWSGAGWDLVTGQGLTWQFSESGALIGIRDDHDNTVLMLREPDDGALGERDGDVTAIVSPSGHWISLAYDRQDRVLSASNHLGDTVTYTYRKNLLTRVVASGYDRGPPVSVLGYRYDQDNRLVAVNSNGHHVLRLGYDDAGRVARQVLADGSRFRFSYRTGRDRVAVEDLDRTVNVEVVTQATVVDPAGMVRRVRFDRGRWVVDTWAAGTPAEDTFRARRDPRTGLVTTLVASGERTAYRYDRAGRLVAQVDRAGTAGAVVTRLSYDPGSGQVASISYPDAGTTRFGYDTAGNLVRQTGPDGASLSYGYDDSGRLTRLTDAAGNTTRVGYELGHRVTVTDPAGNTSTEFVDAAGRVTAFTDPLGAVTWYGYDDQDRLTSIVDPTGGGTQFGYHSNGQLRSVTDPAGNTTRYEYNSAGLVTRRGDPVGAVDRFGYDSAGNLTRHVDRRGVLTTFDHDAVGRLTRVAFGVGRGGPESTIRYAYDSGGRLVRVEDSAYGLIRLDYDHTGRLVAEHTPAGAVRYRYDTAGRRTAMVLPDGTVTTYRYDPAGRLASIRQGAASVTAHRDPAGRVSRLQLPNQVNAEYGYDARGLLTGINYTSTSGDSLGDLAYRYDEAGQQMAATGSLLNPVPPEPMADAEYDKANRLVALAGQRFRYDPAGNLVFDGTNRYVWDARGQLARVSGPVNARFGYDPFGRRTTTSIDGRTTRYVYDGANIVQHSGPGGATSYLIGLGLDEVLARTSGACQITTYLSDAQGSVVGLVDPTGQIATGYGYDPYGVTVTSGEPDPNPFGYTGREQDPTGLYYLRARYYQPHTGRFLSEDPLGFAGGDTNLYAYTANRPTTATDPTGQSLIACYGAAFSGLFAVLDNVDQAIDLTLAHSRGEIGDIKHDIRIDKILRENEILTGLIATMCGGAALGIPGYAGLAATGATSLGRATLTNLGTRITSRFPTLTRQTLTTRATTAANTGDEAFHYTFSRFAKSIESKGLRPGSYATPNGKLSPLQAQIDLALPPNRGLPDALIRVDLAGLRKAGYEIPRSNQVGRSFNMPGGGTEMQFPYAIPPEFLKVIPR